MNDNYRHSFGAALLVMMESLRDSVTAAGGDEKYVCSAQHLQNISALELICSLATNNVRFIHAPTAVLENAVAAAQAKCEMLHNA